MAVTATVAFEHQELLRRVGIFAQVDRVDIARLVGAVEEVRFAAGELIIREEDRADSLYLLASGSVDVLVRVNGIDQKIGRCSAPDTFGELGLLVERRTASVRAATDVQTWRLSRDRFDRLLREHPQIGIGIARALAELVDRRGREAVGAPIPRDDGPRSVIAVRGRTAARRRVLGGALALAVPAILWMLPPPAGLSVIGWHIIAIVTGAAIAWLLEPVPDFAVALAMATAWGVTGLVPLNVSFAGFASSSYVVAVAALGLAAAMAGSGLLFRSALLLLHLFPPTHRGQLAALLVSGTALTPLVPTMYGRVATIAPIAHEVAQALGYQPRSRAIAAITFAAFIGNAFFSSVFLTGVVTNFLVLEMLSPVQRAGFDWIHWLLAAAPAGALILIGAFVVLLVLLPPEAAPRTTTAVRGRQERVLGRLVRSERVALGGLFVFVVGLASQPAHGIDSAWVGLLALFIVIAGRAIDRAAFRTAIDWPTLVFFGVLFGVGGVLRTGGVERWMSAAVGPLAQAAGDPVIVLAGLALFVIAIRLVLPVMPAALLLALTLVPAAAGLGLNAWVVGFVVLTVRITWLVPAQNELLRAVRQATSDEAFTDRQAFAVGVAMTVVTVAAVLASVPYWRALGLM